MKQNSFVIKVSKNEVISATLEVVGNHYQSSLNNFFTDYNIIAEVENNLYHKALALFPEVEEIPRNWIRVEQQKDKTIFVGTMPKLILDIRNETNRISIFDISNGQIYNKRTISRDRLEYYKGVC